MWRRPRPRARTVTTREGARPRAQQRICPENPDDERQSIGAIHGLPYFMSDCAHRMSACQRVQVDLDAGAITFAE